jgi:hypothetical protein
MNPINKAGLVGVLACGLAACQDLEVINENNPDTERALREPAEVETVIRSAFGPWRSPLNNVDLGVYIMISSGEIASTNIIRQVQPSFEPRQGLKNDPVADEVWIPRSPWDQYNSSLANAVDGLHRIIDDGLVIETIDPGATEVTDNTVRARVFGKFMEGMALGYLGLIFDKNAPYTHNDHLPQGYDEVVAWEVSHLKPYNEVTQVAVSMLEEAIAEIDANPPFSTPVEWMSQVRTSAELRQIANSFIARFLVYSARTPAERAAVNWQKVLNATANGITTDFTVTLGNSPGYGTAQHLSRVQSNTNGYHASYYWIGAADVSGKYQAWRAAPLETRNRFEITTPDRRITGLTPTSNGAYFRYRPTDSGFTTTRGTYNYSAYQWYRKNGASNSGTWTLMSADENRLLRAEAFLRTGNLQEAANLINVSRTRTVRISTTDYQGLPAVTPQGVVQSATCVPRNPTSGACGTLMEALIYEREIEGGGWDPLRTWFDRRGLGTLLPGTILHLAIPGRYLVSMGIPIYSFGGVGGPGAAQ